MWMKLIKEALRMEGSRPSLMGLLKKAEKTDNSKHESWMKLIKEALRMEGARPSLMELLKKAEKADNSRISRY